jgi:DNA replication initiation complex subunit (GINS family)
MKRQASISSSSDKVQQIGDELSRLFQRQIELTKREALVGLTPTEREEYEKVVQGIRQSYIELAKVRPD